MRIVFTDSAIAQLNKIADESRREFGDLVAEELEKKFRQIFGAIAMAPKGGSRVIARPGVHSIPLVRYPFKIYYRIADETVEVLHIHRTSQRPWEEYPWSREIHVTDFGRFESGGRCRWALEVVPVVTALPMADWLSGGPNAE